MSRCGSPTGWSDANPYSWRLISQDGAPCRAANGIPIPVDGIDRGGDALRIFGWRLTAAASPTEIPATWVFKIPYLVSYISNYMKLPPGDVMCSGTPGGVGRKPPPPFFLAPGHTMRLGIEGLGEQRTHIV